MKLIVENLSIQRAGLEIVAGISFELSAGEALIVTGENGSGKSTTLRGVAGLLPLAGGRIELSDDTGKAFEEPVREFCHYLGHQNGLKTSLTVRENLEFWQDFMGDEHLSVEEALDEVDLSHVVDLPSTIFPQVRNAGSRLHGFWSQTVRSGFWMNPPPVSTHNPLTYSPASPGISAQMTAF